MGAAMRVKTSRFLRAGLGLLAAALAAAPPALAHHSGAMFDTSKKVTITGTVKEFQWTNPHAFIEVEALNTAGGVDHWSVEMTSPLFLARRGFSRNSLKPGDKVILVLSPLKDGTKGGLFASVESLNGKPLELTPQ